MHLKSIKKCFIANDLLLRKLLPAYIIHLECGSDVSMSKFVLKIFIFTSCNSWCGRIMTCFLCNLRDCVKHLTSQRPGAERSDRVHGRPHFESHNKAKSKLYHKIFQKRRSKTSKWILQSERAN